MIESYASAVDFIFKQTPAFQNVGSHALRYDLTNITQFLTHLGNPHTTLKCIHVAGTNGKGSVCHLLASALHSQGFKVGLFTSPHLIDYRERIKMNGEWITKDYVTCFVQTHQNYIALHSLSFFELTTAMAFAYFEEYKVDYAVIETGLGGRLDSTNIISPMVSVITTIGLDHCDILGDTLSQIASEKAGIIKPNTPYILGEIAPMGLSSIYTYADKQQAVEWTDSSTEFNEALEIFELPFMKENVTTALKVLTYIQSQYRSIDIEKVKQAWQVIVSKWGFYGRFLPIQTKPTVLLEVGHNSQAIKKWKENLSFYTYRRLILILSVTQERDLTEIIAQLPPFSQLFFMETSNPRSRKREDYISTYPEARVLNSMEELNQTINGSDTINDLVLIGGSFFLVADYLNFNLNKKSKNL